MSQSQRALQAHESLVFDPGEDWPSQRSRLNDVHKFLFRVASPRSGGLTDDMWVKSADAQKGSRNQSVDIFARSDRKACAAMLSRHLWGRYGPGKEDNMVSWTNSLLVALLYISYRRYNVKDGSDLSAIRLYVVDTTQFPKGTFMRDMHLIRAFAPYNAELRSLRNLRERKRKELNGSYYFGEYLTQGALRIEGKHWSVSAAAMIDRGLYDLLPEMRQVLSPTKTPWANRVIAFRKALFGKHREVEGSQIQAGLDIAALFGEQWQLLMAAYLVALLPVRNNEPQILEAFKLAEFEAAEYTRCATHLKRMPKEPLLPELQQTRRIMGLLHSASRMTAVKRCLLSAQDATRSVSSLGRARDESIIWSLFGEDIRELVYMLQELEEMSGGAGRVISRRVDLME